MKKIINTSGAPAPIGPYSQAVFIGNTLYISGQIAMDPVSGELINGDVQQETVQVMENLRAILGEAGMDFGNVVKSTIFIKDIRQFGKINEIYARYVDAASPPARETVEVANLPKFVSVEISMIAVK